MKPIDQAIDYYANSVDSIGAAEAHAELAELRADAGRLEWVKLMLSGGTRVFVAHDCNNAILPWGTYLKRSRRPKPLNRFKDCNAAIDDAMKEADGERATQSRSR